MTDVRRFTVRQLMVRIMVLFFLANLISQFDRANVGYAALQMNKDLSFTPQIFGFGAGVFFIGYALFGLPSNLISFRVRVPLWICGLMVVWGLAASCLGFVQNPTAFYVLRFILGLAEGGFTPLVYLYVSQCFPKDDRGTALGTFIAAAALASIIVGPISTAMLSFSWLGMHGWRWMFIFEGLPAIVMGFVVLALLPAKPTEASWLGADGRAWLQQELAAEAAGKTRRDQMDFLASLRSKAVWLYSAALFFTTIGTWGIVFWFPQVTKAGFPGISNFQIGLVTSIPYALAFFTTMLFGVTSDRTGDRQWHIAILSGLAGICLLISTQFPNPTVGYIAVSLAIIGALGLVPIYFASPASIFGGSAAAGAYAIMLALGNIGGFVGPYVFGLLKGSTGSFTLGIAFYGISFFVTAVLVVLLGDLFPSVQRAGQPAAAGGTLP